MSNPLRKPDSHIFEWLLDKQTRQIVSETATHWPRYAFHFSNITNIPSIMRSGELLSRAALDAKGIVRHDAADQKVIAQTGPDVKNFVRLYFRPRTPTAYLTEGFRPNRPPVSGKPHCPVPIYLLFDMKDFITLRQSSFSDGNLARKSRRIMSTAADFARLPFHDIYSEGRPDDVRRREIVNYRHAEVIVPDSLSLEHLRAIMCRSQPEYDTLRHLVGELWTLWGEKTRIVREPKTTLFDMLWLHVSAATLSNGFAKLQFHPPHENYCGPFNFRIHVVDNFTGLSNVFEKDVTDVRLDLNNMMLRLDLAKFRGRNYTLRLEIDGNLAYLGKYEPEVPF